MTTNVPRPISIDDAVGTLSFLADRTPMTTSEQAKDAFAELASYREGGVFIGHWAGTSEWERHTSGDELVVVIAGETTIYFRAAETSPSARLRAGEFVVVPQGTWHRFETSVPVTLLSVTPQPTDHSADAPSEN